MRKLLDLRSTNVEESLEQCWAVVPFGSIEQHGPHLPLGVDLFLAEAMAKNVAEAIGGVLCPTIPIGARSIANSGGGMSLPGTLALDGTTLIALYCQLIAGLVSNGAKRILCLNGHWENEPFIVEAIDQFGPKEGTQIIAASWWSVVGEEEVHSHFPSFAGWHLEHAAQVETSLMLHYFDELVSMRDAIDGRCKIPAGVFRWPTPSEWLESQGVLWESTTASALKGKQFAKCILKGFLDLLVISQE